MATARCRIWAIIISRTRTPNTVAGVMAVAQAKSDGRNEGQFDGQGAGRYAVQYPWLEWGTKKAPAHLEVRARAAGWMGEMF